MRTQRPSIIVREGGRTSSHDATPPPLERPWWMRINGEQPASNLEEVMDQFLCDSEAQMVQRSCERAAKKFDLKSVSRVVPGVDQEQMESMKKWYGHVTGFLKYRNQVAEKHERQMEMRLHRKTPDLWDNFESDEESGSEAPSVAATPSARSEAAVGRTADCGSVCHWFESSQPGPSARGACAIASWDSCGAEVFLLLRLPVGRTWPAVLHVPFATAKLEDLPQREMVRRQEWSGQPLSLGPKGCRFHG